MIFNIISCLKVEWFKEWLKLLVMRIFFEWIVKLFELYWKKCMKNYEGWFNIWLNVVKGYEINMEVLDDR